MFKRLKPNILKLLSESALPPDDTVEKIFSEATIINKISELQAFTINELKKIFNDYKVPKEERERYLNMFLFSTNCYIKTYKQEFLND